MHFVEKIMPEWERMGDQLNKRLMSFPHLDELDQPYHVYLRSVKNQIDLFREENIPLQEQDQKLATEYQAMRAAMMVPINDKRLTSASVSISWIYWSWCKERGVWPDGRKTITW